MYVVPDEPTVTRSTGASIGRPSGQDLVRRLQTWGQRARCINSRWVSDPTYSSDCQSGTHPLWKGSRHGRNRDARGEMKAVGTYRTAILSTQNTGQGCLTWGSVIVSMCQCAMPIRLWWVVTGGGGGSSFSLKKGLATSEKYWN